MNHEVTTADLCRLLGVSREMISNLAKRGIVTKVVKLNDNQRHDEGHASTQAYRVNVFR